MSGLLENTEKFKDTVDFDCISGGNIVELHRISNITFRNSELSSGNGRFLKPQIATTKFVSWAQFLPVCVRAPT